MKFRCPRKWIQLTASGALLFQFAGCLGPNPGFFISSSTANASIFTLVNAFLSNLINAGVG